VIRSVDTNVVVRAIVGDDPSQSEVAERVLAEGAIIVVTVVLEVIWVLGSRYGKTPTEIVADLRDIFSLRSVELVSARAVNWALDRYLAGADFEDMLHCALSGQADAFATFDRSVARFAGDSPVPVETLRP
jgi:predicted nucleic acid-binding protein